MGKSLHLGDYQMVSLGASGSVYRFICSQVTDPFPKSNTAHTDSCRSQHTFLLSSYDSIYNFSFTGEQMDRNSCVQASRRIREKPDSRVMESLPRYLHPGFSHRNFCVLVDSADLPGHGFIPARCPVEDAIGNSPAGCFED